MTMTATPTRDERLKTLIPSHASTSAETAMVDELRAMFEATPRLSPGDLEVAMIDVGAASLAGTSILMLVMKRLEEFIKANKMGRPDLSELDKHLLRAKKHLTKEQVGENLRPVLMKAKEVSATLGDLHRIIRDKGLNDGIHKPWTNEDMEAIVDHLGIPAPVDDSDDEDSWIAKTEPTPQGPAVETVLAPAPAETVATTESQEGPAPEVMTFPSEEELTESRVIVAVTAINNMEVAEGLDAEQVRAVIQDAIRFTGTLLPNVLKAYENANLKETGKLTFETAKAWANAIYDLAGGKRPEPKEIVLEAPITEATTSVGEEVVEPPMPNVDCVLCGRKSVVGTSMPDTCDECIQATQGQKYQTPIEGQELPEEVEKPSDILVTLGVAFDNLAGDAKARVFWDRSEWVIKEKEDGLIVISCTKKLDHRQRGKNSLAKLPTDTLVAVERPVEWPAEILRDVVALPKAKKVEELPEPTEQEETIAAPDPSADAPATMQNPYTQSEIATTRIQQLLLTRSEKAEELNDIDKEIALEMANNSHARHYFELQLVWAEQIRQANRGALQFTK